MIDSELKKEINSEIISGPFEVNMPDLSQEQWDALNKAEQESRVTVGRLKRLLKGYSDDTEITFGCKVDATPLVFYRVKQRGKKLIQIAINELWHIGV